VTTQSGDPAARAKAAAASPGELASEVAKDMSTLVRQEVALAKAELQQEAKTAGTAVGAFGGAGFAGYFVLVFVSLAAMYGDADRLGCADRGRGLGGGRGGARHAGPQQAQGVQPEAGAHHRDGEGGRAVGEDPERLEREIEATRAKLGQDIDALEEKVNPKKVAHRSVESAKEKAAEVKDKVVAKAAEAKEKATSSGNGGGDESPGLGQKATGLAGTVKEKAAPLVGTAREKAQPLVDRAAPAAQQVKEKAAIRAGLDPQTADTKQVATTLAGETWATVQDQTRRNPALVGAVAFVLGFLLGR
jgi:Protein of unknown function (DUF3618)/Putative Actinobacterial Holin-X, holin superfamily III